MKRSAWLLVLLFVVSLPAVTLRLYASDEIEYYSYLRSIWFDHDVSFDNEYRYFADHGIARGPGFRETFLGLTSSTGRRLNFGTIGSAILWSPMYAVADAGVRVARAMGSPVAADGYSRPYLAAVAYGSALYGFLAVLLSAFIAQRLVGRGPLAAALVWFGTPLPFYMYLAPGMAHACSAFVVAVFVLIWLRVREEWSTRGLMALGAVAALMTMVREQDVFFVAGVGVDYLWTLAAARRTGQRLGLGKRLEGLLVGVATFIVCFLPQAWAYIALNGYVGPARIVQDKMRWYSPHGAQVLFSPEHGFFVWTPLALVCVVGLVVAVCRSPGAASASPPASRGRLSDVQRIGVCLLVMFLAQVYISGSVDTWTVAGSFGQRRFLCTTVGLVVGLAAVLQAAKGWQRRAVGAVIVVSIWWNLGLMAQFGAGMMDRQQLDVGLNAYNTFVRVPIEMPGLAYRYLFDRASFYRPAAP